MLGFELDTPSLTSNIHSTNTTADGELLPTVILVIDSMGYLINLLNKMHTGTIMATLLWSTNCFPIIFSFVHKI